MHTSVGEYARAKQMLSKPSDVNNGGTQGREWMQRNWEPSFRCVADKRMGVPGDGGKWVCDPDCLLAVNDCTVFSVGSNNQFDFEQSLDPYGCDVHIFDHTVANPRMPPHVAWTFHRFGAATASGGNMLSLQGMAARSNVSYIDVLKIDCEGCEYTVLRDPATLHFLREHVKQILVEVHFTNAADTADLATKLAFAGFRVFSKEPNIQFSDGGCLEYSLLNLRRHPRSA